MTSQDLVKGIDITGLTKVTGSELIQLIDAGRLASDKGIRIITTDTAVGVPDVPDPSDTVEGVAVTFWSRYKWVRISHEDEPEPFVKEYCWNPNAASDATYLRWYDLETKAEAAQDAADAAQADATQALTDSAAAVTTANNALTTANAAQTTATAAYTLGETAIATNVIQDAQISNINDRLDTITDQIGETTFPLSVPNGGTGSNNTGGARSNLGLAKAAIHTVFLKDVKAQGTNGGTFTAGAWRDRALNTKSGTTAGYVTLDSITGIFTLTRGSYILEAEVPGVSVDAHSAVLYNETDGEIHTIGSSELAIDSSSASSYSKIFAYIEIDATTEFKIQHYCTSTQADTGFGYPTNIAGKSEVYTQVKISVLGDS